LLKVGALALLVAGCTSGAKSVAQKDGGTDQGKPLFGVPKSAPTDLDKSRLRLLHLNRALYLTDDDDQAAEVFGSPPGAVDINELPENWDVKAYRAKGWQKSREAFGAIYYKDRIALAQFSQDDLGLADVTSLLGDYNDLLEPPKRLSSAAGKVQYYFWSGPKQLLMINVQNTGGHYKVTQSLGAEELMEALHMTPETATSDLATLNDLQTVPASN
jgi:hypothetical protein